MTEPIGIGSILLLLVSCVLTNNFLFTRFPGVYLFRGDRVKSAALLGLCATVVLAVASLLVSMLNTWLTPLNLGYFSVLGTLLILLLLVQLLKVLYSRRNEEAAAAAKAWVPMLLVNCLVMGVLLFNQSQGSDLLTSFLTGLFGGLGFLVAIVLMAGVQERLTTSNIPKPMRGIPIDLVSAGLIAAAFMGFAGLA